MIYCLLSIKKSCHVVCTEIYKLYQEGKVDVKVLKILKFFLTWVRGYSKRRSFYILIILRLSDL